MTEDEWIDRYKPVSNHFDEGRGYDGTLFETYGEELDHVCQADPKKVWTLIDGEGSTVITNGYHFVNRMGYFITEEPFEGDFLEIVIDEYDEDTCDTEGCTNSLDDGEGYDGYCGICADRREQEALPTCSEAPCINKVVDENEVYCEEHLLPY